MSKQWKKYARWENGSEVLFENHGTHGKTRKNQKSQILSVYSVYSVVSLPDFVPKKKLL
jgi:hypothetical protein